jgi:5-formaminoimidazole-4-carboxamide-1-beta-D-ribofuranosyl 5'-monophosphate synthetase
MNFNRLLSIVVVKGTFAGGRGYFLAWDKKSFDGVEKLIKNNTIEGEEELYIQEYVSINSRWSWYT